MKLNFTGWNFILLIAVSLMGTTLAYLHHPKWKAFILSLLSLLLPSGLRLRAGACKWTFSAESIVDSAEFAIYSLTPDTWISTPYRSRGVTSVIVLGRFAECCSALTDGLIITFLLGFKHREKMSYDWKLC